MAIADQKIVIQDPRTSTPGLGLVLWMKSVYGDQAADAWAKLRPRILTVTPGWSEAYGLFTKGEAEMVLSYTTSPAYHVIAESSQRYQAAAFSEGHYLQIEVAGQTKKGAANPLAKQFLEFMLTPEFQDIIPETNWMLPAATTSKPLNPVFAGLVQPAKIWLNSPEEVADEPQCLGRRMAGGDEQVMARAVFTALDQGRLARGYSALALILAFCGAALLTIVPLGAPGLADADDQRPVADPALHACAGVSLDAHFSEPRHPGGVRAGPVPGVSRTERYHRPVWSAAFASRARRRRSASWRCSDAMAGRRMCLSIAGVSHRPNIYGLSGMLTAHVFFNFPLAVSLFLNALADHS